MGETTEQITDEIEQARNSLDRDLARFEQRLHQETDWKVQFGRHPWFALGCALIAGYLFSRVFSS